MLNTNLPLMKRSIYQPAIECSCGLHTWPTLLQSVCKGKYDIRHLLKVGLECVVTDTMHFAPM